MSHFTRRTPDDLPDAGRPPPLAWAPWTILLALAAQHGELAGLVDPVTDDDWERPTRCVGWDVAAVLLHLAETDEFATASAHGDLGGFRNGFLGSRDEQTVTVDDAAAAQVDAERAAGGDAIRQRWHEASAAMRAAFEAGDPHQRVTWVVRSTLPAHARRDATVGMLDPHRRHRGRARHRAPAHRSAPPHRGTRVADAPLRVRTRRHSNARTGRARPDRAERGTVAVRTRYPRDTTIRGSAAEFCDVAARRVDPDATTLVGDGPDAAAVLRYVRTYAL